MPRMIYFVCLLGCVGCVGPGKVAPKTAETSVHRLPRIQTASYRSGVEGQLHEAEMLEELPPDPSFATAKNLAANKDLAAQDLSTRDLTSPDLTSPTHDQITDLEPLPSQLDLLQVNLPTVLNMVGGQHPAVGLAQWRVQEAYAKLDSARALWLPSIQTGFSFDKHDGNYQASDGTIVDVNRNSFQYGLGAGATGAGTTPRPGLVAQFHFADAIFQPKIASKTASARGHAANAIVNQQLMIAAIAYLDLLDAHQDGRIVAETRDRTSELFKLTSDFSATGKGLQADADRLGTELALLENRVLSASERIDVAGAKLAQAVSAQAGSQIVPMDPTVVPIELVSIESDKSTLIRTGLSNRPELKESQSLVSAACDQHRRQKYAPFIPSVLLGFSTGEFGGGLGNNLNNLDSRYDFDAVVTWEMRNLGFGERAARREANSRIQQAKFEKIRVMDQVAREVAEAHSQVWHRTQQIAITRQAIQSAEDSYERNLSRIRDGQGLPLEVLQSLRALGRRETSVPDVSRRLQQGPVPPAVVTRLASHRAAIPLRKHLERGLWDSATLLVWLGKSFQKRVHGVAAQWSRQIHGGRHSFCSDFGYSDTLCSVLAELRTGVPTVGG